MSNNLPASHKFVIGCATVMVMIGLLCGGAGVVGVLQARKTKAEPQALTVKELIDHGYGDNAHVLLSDFDMLAESAVIEEKSIVKSWEKVWVPLVPAGQEEVKSLRVVLQAKDIKNEDQLMKLAEEPQVQGVVDVLSSIGSEERDLFKESFPDADLSQVLLVRQVDLGQEEPPAAFFLICAVPGLLMLVIGAALIVYSWFRARAYLAKQM